MKLNKDYFKKSKQPRVMVYHNLVTTELDRLRDSISAMRTKAIMDGNKEVTDAYTNVLYELAFSGSTILSNQIKED